jgi:hypothetical protein
LKAIRWADGRKDGRTGGRKDGGGRLKADRRASGRPQSLSPQLRVRSTTAGNSPRSRLPGRQESSTAPSTVVGPLMCGVTVAAGGSERTLRRQQFGLEDVQRGMPIARDRGASTGPFLHHSTAADIHQVSPFPAASTAHPEVIRRLGQRGRQDEPPRQRRASGQPAHRQHLMEWSPRGPERKGRP